MDCCRPRNPKISDERARLEGNITVLKLQFMVARVLTANPQSHVSNNSSLSALHTSTSFSFLNQKSIKSTAILRRVPWLLSRSDLVVYLPNSTAFTILYMITKA
jgi:hypothetical protein